MSGRTRSVLPGIWMVAAVVVLDLATADLAHAIPAFSRRYETSCGTCHQYHFPRLNSYGRRFRENGYQLPDGAEDRPRATRMVEPGRPGERLSVFKEVPLSMRGQVFSTVKVHAADETTPIYDNSLLSFIIGGGTVARNVSYFFTWTPFPDASVHQARVGVHNIAHGTLGEGTLNVRAGALFLLDFQRPGHRFLSVGATSATSTAVGLNRFSFDESTLGVQAYGRPGWGPFHYELAVVSGDPGDSATDRDQWKDVFARASYIWFYNTDHELRVGAFGYLGRSDIVTDFGGVELAQRDDFYMAGGDVEVDLGPVNLSAMGYFGHHGDPLPTGGEVSVLAGRVEGIWSIGQRLVAAARLELVSSHDDSSLDRKLLAPHVTYQISSNVLASLVWRQNLDDADASSGVLVLDAAF